MFHICETLLITLLTLLVFSLNIIELIRWTISFYLIKYFFCLNKLINKFE